MRVAVVTGGAESVPQIEAYLPDNYKVQTVYGRGIGARDNGLIPVIVGEDVAGWTLDEYVIPRLASGLIFATEFTA